MSQQLLWLALAGAIGTLARFGVGNLVTRWGGGEFPYGTLVVNLLGCFLFGLVVHLADHRQWLRPEVKQVCLTGFMGAFTTFSTFAAESSHLLREAAWSTAAANVLLQNIGGIACVFLGLAAGRMLGI